MAHAGGEAGKSHRPSRGSGINWPEISVVSTAEARQRTRLKPRRIGRRATDTTRQGPRPWHVRWGTAPVAPCSYAA